MLCIESGGAVPRIKRVWLSFREGAIKATLHGSFGLIADSHDSPRSDKSENTALTKAISI